MSIKLGDNDITGGININALKQAIYDGMFPVGYEHIGIACIGVPSGVTATWTELNVLDNRFPMVLSTSAVKTLLDEELPNITGNLGFYRGTAEQCKGVFDGSYVGREWWKTMTDSSVNGENVRVDLNASKGQVDTTKTSGYRSQAESVYKDNGVVRPKTFTVKHWKRTA